MWRRLASRGALLRAAPLLSAHVQGACCAAAAGGMGAAPLLGTGMIRTLHGPTSSVRRATKEETLTSGRAPTSTPPDDPVESSHNFDRLADLYLGGLWDKVQVALQTAAREHKGFECDAQLEHDGMTLSLPEGGKIFIEKDPGQQSLVVHTNLHDTYGSDGAENHILFKLQGDRSWEVDGEELHQFLEDGLAKHLKLQVDLEPDAQTIYGPDPT